MMFLEGLIYSMLLLLIALKLVLQGFIVSLIIQVVVYILTGFNVYKAIVNFVERGDFFYEYKHKGKAKKKNTGISY